jgi:hypothetical protein
MIDYVPSKTVNLSPKDETNWALTIGKFILVFADVEWTSHRWILFLANDRSIKDKALKSTLNRRLKMIYQFIQDAKFSPKVSNKALSLWKEIETLSKTRNTIAHNPIICAPIPSEEPIFGIINVKDTIGSGPYHIHFLEPSVIMTMTNRVKEIVNELENLLVKQNNNPST